MPIIVLIIPLYLYLSIKINKLKIHWILKWAIYMFVVYAGFAALSNIA